MQKFRLKDATVEAIRITDEDFTEAHPNPRHVPGVEYFGQRTVRIRQTLHGSQGATVGDWIVRRPDGRVFAMSDEKFQERYTPREHEIPRANLGCATTRQLLDELRARVGNLEYRPVD